jgi:hypothetical protein
MTDAQSLLVVAALIYLSDCAVWLPRDAVAVVIPICGRPFVRTPSAWAGNDRGGLAFTTLLPARAVFICRPSDDFHRRRIEKRLAEVLDRTRLLNTLSMIAFIALFGVAPLLSWRFGFMQIGVFVLLGLLLINALVAFAFFRTAARLQPFDRAHRWAHALVMLVATPAAIHAVGRASHDAMRKFDALAVAARIAGEDHPAVRCILRELAHPAGGFPPTKRYEAAQTAGLSHVEEPPAACGGAAAYCPRCLALYGVDKGVCADCEVELRSLL